jgi:hypothetical protein
MKHNRGFRKKYGKPFSWVHWWKIHVDMNGNSEERPIGREAMKAEPKGKWKAEQVMDGIVLLGDNITKLIEVTQERMKEHEKVTEAQLEISRLHLQVAKAQKEAKLIEAYNSLLVRDTSHRSKEAKAS